MRLTLFFITQKTAYDMRISDWSSDVCSSDLLPIPKARRCDRRASDQRDDGRAQANSGARGDLSKSAGTRSSIGKRQAGRAAQGQAITWNLFDDILAFGGALGRDRKSVGEGTSV